MTHSEQNDKKYHCSVILLDKQNGEDPLEQSRIREMRITLRLKLKFGHNIGAFYRSCLPIHILVRRDVVTLLVSGDADFGCEVQRALFAIATTSL